MTKRRQEFRKGFRTDIDWSYYHDVEEFLQGKISARIGPYMCADGHSRVMIYARPQEWTILKLKHGDGWNKMMSLVNKLSVEDELADILAKEISAEIDKEILDGFEGLYMNS